MSLKPVKIMHFSDCHLDTKFVGLDDKRAIMRREELRDTFKRLFLHAKDSNTDIILISGDIFDSNSVSIQTLTHILDCFALVPDIKIFICAGNHDPFESGSIYQSLRLPDNVYVFPTDGGMICIEELKLCIYGISMKDGATPFEPIDFFGAYSYSPEYINIILTHAPQLYVEKAEPQFSFNDVEYIATGHIHKFEGIKKTGYSTIAHPGIMEPRSFKDTGKHGFIEGIVGKNVCDLKFVPFQKREYISDSICISDCNSYEDIYEILDNVVCDADNLYDINITGTTFLELNTDILEDYLKDKCFFVRFDNSTHKGYDFDNLRLENSLRGFFVNELMGRIDEEHDSEKIAILKRALVLGLEAIDNTKEEV